MTVRVVQWSGVGKATVPTVFSRSAENLEIAIGVHGKPLPWAIKTRPSPRPALSRPSLHRPRHTVRLLLRGLQRR